MGKPEAYVEDYLRKQCKQNSFLIYKFVSPGYRGVPDDMIIAHGRVVFVECKAEHGRVSDIQKAVIKQMRESGADVRVFNSREQVDELIKELKGSSGELITREMHNTPTGCSGG